MSRNPRPTTSVLGNGITLIDAPRADAPTVAITLVVKNGLLDLTDDDAAALTMLGSAFRRATKSTPDTQKLLARIDDLGASIGMSVGRESTTVRGEASKEHAQELLALMAELVCEPTFDAGELESYKTLLVKGIERRDQDPSSWVGEHSGEAFWQHSSTAARPSYGSLAALRAAGPARLEQVHRGLFDPANMAVSVAGGVSLSAADVEAAFGSLQSETLSTSTGRSKTSPVWAKTNPATSRIRPVAEGEEAMVTMLAGIPIPSIDVNNPADQRRLLAHSILQQVLSGGMSTRLFHQVRERNGLVYSISSRLGMARDAAYVQVSSWMTPPANGPIAMEMVSGILRDVAAPAGAPGAMTAGEIRKGRALARFGMLVGSRVPSNASATYAGQWAAGRDLRTPSERARALDQITDEEVRAAAREIVAGLDRVRVLADAPSHDIALQLLDALSTAGKQQLQEVA